MALVVLGAGSLPRDPHAVDQDFQRSETAGPNDPLGHLLGNFLAKQELAAATALHPGHRRRPSTQGR